MKKMRFAVWFTALLAVLTFSSCLDSDGGGQRQGMEIVRVEGFMGSYSFKSASGYELIPSNSGQLTMDINTEYAYIQYVYDSENVTPETKKIPVELTGVMPIRSQYINRNIEGMKDDANAPIANISTGGSYTYFPVTFWNPNTMFLPVNYFIKDAADQKELQSEVATHSFTVYFDENDPDGSDDQMILHVRHHVIDPSLNEKRQRINTNIYHVDLTQIMYDFERKNGQKPSTIVFEYEQGESGRYGENYVSSSRSELSYSEILGAFKK